MSKGPEAGWYPNPEDPTQVRWWDGKEWTAHTERNPMAPITPPVQSSPGMPPAPGPGDAAPQPLSAATANYRIPDWINETFSLLRKQVRPLAMLSLVLGVVPSVVSSIVMWNALEGFEFFMSEDGTEAELTGIDANEIVLVGVVLLMMQAFSLVLWTAFCRQIYLGKQGRSEPWTESARLAVMRLPRLVGACVMVALAMTVLLVAMTMVVSISAVAPVLLIVTLPLTVVGFLYVSTRLSLFFVSAALAPKGTYSINNSATLTKDRSSMLMGRLFLLFGFMMVVSMIMSIAMQGFGIGAPISPEPGGDVMLTFEMLYGSNQVWFTCVSVLFGIANLAMVGSMVAGLVLLYLNFGGAVDPELQRSAHNDGLVGAGSVSDDQGAPLQ